MSIEITLETLPAYLRGEGHPNLATEIEQAGKNTATVIDTLDHAAQVLPGDSQAYEVVTALARVITIASQGPDISQLTAETEQAITHRDTEIFEVTTNPGDRPLSHHPDNVRAGLIEAGARRQLADLLGRDASLDTADWARAARKLTPPLSVTEIARLTGATRGAVYGWITP